MKKVDKDFLTQALNKSAPKGHQVTKLYTSSHSDKVTRVACSCGNQHPNLDNSKVGWGVNLEIKWGMQ